MIKDNIIYQTNASSDIKRRTESLLTSTTKTDDKNVILLDAPTGSGKTIIAIKYIQSMNMEYDNLCFLWVSSATGNLHRQSFNKIKANINSINEGADKINVLILDELNNNSLVEIKKFNKNNLIVFNWEKVNRIKENEFDSKHMKSKGEFFSKSFRNILNKMKEKNYKVILIIDECHNLGENSSKVVEYLNPDVILAMSATPRRDKLSQDEKVKGVLDLYSKTKRSNEIIIDSDEVISENMIKEFLCINSGLKSCRELNPTLDSDFTYLKCAMDMRNRIENECLKNNVSLNPLLLIQVPNGEGGNSLIKKIEKELLKYGISEVNKNLTRWLDNDKVNTFDISSNTSEVKCLIFKQGIAQGWDCPRASVLLCYRDIKSKTLEQQVVGRILRTVNQQKYNNEFIDNAYLYTSFRENEDMEIIKSPYNNVKNDENMVFVSLKDDIQNIKLTKQMVQSRIKKEINKIKNIENLETELSNQILTNQNMVRLLTDKNVDKILSEIKIKDTDKGEQEMKSKKMIDNSTNKNVIKVKVKSYKYELANENFDNYFRANILRVIPNAYSYAEKNVIYDTVLRTLIILIEDKIKDTNNVYKLYFHFKDSINFMINDILSTEKNSVKKGPVLADSLYSLSLQDSYGDAYEKVTDFDKYAYSEIYLRKDRSQAELNFENNFISVNEDLIMWWYKNKETKDSLSFQRYVSSENLMYPDYIIRLNNKVLLLEIKHENQKDTDDIEDKIKTLHRYIKKETSKSIAVDGGFVIEKNGIYYVSRSSHSKISEISNTDWLPLSELLK